MSDNDNKITMMISNIATHINDYKKIEYILNNIDAVLKTYAMNRYNTIKDTDYVEIYGPYIQRFDELSIITADYVILKVEIKDQNLYYFGEINITVLANLFGTKFEKTLSIQTDSYMFTNETRICTNQFNNPQFKDDLKDIIDLLGYKEKGK